jgi:ferredoxin-NADP reductase
MRYIAKILKIEPVTYNVKRFILEKPKNFKFIPGQATDVSINLPKWKEEKRPFTFTSLNDDLILEFTIKSYPEHNGVTKKLHELSPGDELIIEDPFGTINYKGTGVFIAGGAGITPFIAILRQLRKENKLKRNKLIFSNKTSRDIILEKEFKDMFPKEDLILTLTEEKNSNYEFGMINKEFLKKYVNNFHQFFYICGPPGFVASIKEELKSLGASKDILVIEA